MVCVIVSGRICGLNTCGVKEEEEEEGERRRRRRSGRVHHDSDSPHASLHELPPVVGYAPAEGASSWKTPGAAGVPVR